MFNIRVNVDVDADRVRDLIITGIEHMNYGTFNVVGYEGETKEGDQTEHPRYAYFPLTQGRSVRLVDRYEGGDRQEDGRGEEHRKVYSLNLFTVKRGLELMAEKCPYQFGQFLNDNADVITADIFLQFALLGEHVYG